MKRAASGRVWWRLATIVVKAVLVIFAATGGIWIAFQVAVAAKIVQPPRTDVIFRSPNGEREVSWAVFYVPSERSICYSGKGPHLIEPHDNVGTGELYFARWRSNDHVDVFVSSDFSLEGVSDRKDTIKADGVTISFVRLKYDPVLGANQLEAGRQ